MKESEDKFINCGNVVTLKQNKDRENWETNFGFRRRATHTQSKPRLALSLAVE